MLRNREAILFELAAAKTIADMIKPVTDPLAKRLVDGPANPGSIVTAALEQRLAQVLTNADLAQLTQRMQRRAKYISMRKQLSYEHAASLALELASLTPPEQLRTVEADWFTKWSEAVEDVSDDMVQGLWAQAFARQTDARSRRVSLRALDTLRLMERQDVVNFMRASEVMAVMGYVFVNSNEVLDRLMRRDDIDALVDLRLLEFEEQMASALAAPGGYSMHFHMPPEFAKEAFKVIRMSARGRELVQTLPPDLEADYAYREGFDVNDPLLVPKYLKLVARGFDRRYEVSLCVFDPKEQRPPVGGRKRTHLWDNNTGGWRRLQTPDSITDPVALSFLESPSGNAS